MDLTETFPADHPALADHFPDRPMAPGVVLLGRLMKHLEQVVGEGECKGVRRVRFLSPVTPGAVMSIRLEAGRKGETRAELSVNGAAAVTAILLHDVHLKVS